MKKRLFSMLLTLCLVVAMIPCMTVNAFAADTVSYTLKAGDTVIKVCQNLGINFYANMNWIMRANNISNFNTLPVGKTLVLPAPGTTPSINDLPGSTGTAGTTGGTASSAPSTGGVANGALLNGDYVYEYLLYHTMVSGDTVGALCNRYGVDFASNSDRIMKINNIKNYNRIAVGKTILLPVTSLPNSGTCIRVIAHRVVSGDTAIGICNSYGISYASSAALMQALNNKTNLSSIKAGQILFVPVPATIVNGSVDVPSTGGNTGSTGGNTGNTGSTATTYTITGQTVNKNMGSYTLSASSAAAGTTITVKTTPAANYALGSVVVQNNSDRSNVSVTYSGNNASFKMPEANVTVTVNFTASTQYTITKATAEHGSFDVQVNGVKSDKALEGQTVHIVATPAAGYEISQISYTYGKNGTGSADINDSFKMPAANVTVTVKFQPMQQYAIEPVNKSPENGTYRITRNNADVTTALAGDTIKLLPSPASGYSVASVTVKGQTNGAIVPVNSDYTFVMPRYAVFVDVTFEAKGYDIKTLVGEHGSYTVTVGGGNPVAAVNGQVPLTAGTDKNIKLVITPDTGYDLESITVTRADGTGVTVTGETLNDRAFKMPATDVTVNVTFKAKPFKVTAKNADSTNPFTITANGQTQTSSDSGVIVEANVGSTVTLAAIPGTLQAGFQISGVSILSWEGGRNYSNTAVVSADGSSATFQMPADNVTVDLKLTKSQLTITTKLEGGSYGGYTVQVNDADPVTATNGGTIKAQVGDKITVSQVGVKDGYGLNVLRITKDSDGSEVARSGWSFTMPPEAVTLTVGFTPNTYKLSFDLPSTTDTYTVTVGTGDKAKSETINNTHKNGLLDAKTGDTVSLKSEVANWKLDTVTVTIGGKEVLKKTINAASGSFVMPGGAPGQSEATVKVTFKQ